MAERKRRTAEEARRIRAAAQNTVGLNYLRQGRNREALAAFEQVLADDPANTKALMGRGVALARTGRFDAALDAAEELRRLDGDSGRVHNTLATIYEYMGRLEEGRAEFEHALALEPDDAAHSYNFACYWARRGDGAKVREHLAEALRLNPASNAFAATDVDFAPFRNEEWFQELVAFKK